MREFSWQYFMMTGDVDAYLLFKATGDHASSEDDSSDEDEGQEE